MHLVFTNKFFLVIIQKGYTLTKKIEHVRKNIAHIFSRVGAVVNPEQNHTKTIHTFRAIHKLRSCRWLFIFCRCSCALDCSTSCTLR